MGKRKLLTVVVPTYNAENYLRDNLESFCIKEVLDDIEILIINDGSTDDSLLIAEEYVEKFPDSYRVITKENGGHGSGINCGIKNASGEYFKVVDADDWVRKEPFVELVNTLKKTSADLVSSGFLWAYDNGEDDIRSFKTQAEIKEPFSGVLYNKVYQFDEICSQLYIKMHSVTIKTDILKNNNIWIDEKCFYVDTEYITYPIPYVETVCFVDEFVYMYRIGNAGQSVSIEKMQKNKLNYDKVMNSLISFYKKLGSEIVCTEQKKSYIAGIIARVVAAKVKIILSFPTSIEKKKELCSFDKMIKDEVPDIYNKNINKAVWALRKTNFALYSIASSIVRKKY